MYGHPFHSSGLQPCNYQLSESVVHEIKFGDMDMVLVCVYFKIGFLNFIDMSYWCTLEAGSTTYVNLINE